MGDRMKRMRLKKEVLVLIVIIILIVIGLMLKTNKPQPVEPKDLDKFIIGKEKHTIKRNEELSVSAWNGLEILFNNKSYDELPKIANGVTIGTNYKDVLKIFDIQEGYAIANMEVSTKEHDGTTDVIEETYRNKSIFRKDYLDLYLLFGYKKVNNEWKMITAKELTKSTDTDKELLIYYIDFNGMEDELVNKGEVIAFSITHQ